MLLATSPRLPELAQRLGDGRSTVYSLSRDGGLTTPVKITCRATTWNQDAVEVHLQRQRVGRIG